jgi:hypothetical protein
MDAQTKSGRCRICERTFGKRQMTIHVRSCWKKHSAPVSAKSAGSWFHLVLDTPYPSDYWLHLPAAGKSSFRDLDQELRRIWLECCQHLSAFRFPVKRSPWGRGGPRNIFELFDGLASAASIRMDDDDDDSLMDETLASKLSPGVRFSHEYDFGSTTTLALRVAGLYRAPVLKGAIKVLARNEPPALQCVVCKKPATQLCTECFDCGGAELCDVCAEKHECGEEMLLPLVNSPRTGVCSYCGPSVEP